MFITAFLFLLFLSCMHFYGYLHLPTPGIWSGLRPLALSPKLYSPALGPNLYLTALAYNFIASPQPELHILTLSPEFVFTFMALAYNLHYRSET